jgi:uncharacterized protein YcbX
MFRRIEPKEIGKIIHLLVYPVKSCAPLEVTSAQVTMQGLETLDLTPIKDREYMIVEASPETSSGHYKFITQRDRGAQKLALITPLISNGKLVLAWRDQGGVEIPGLKSGHELPVRVHSYKTTGVDQGDEVARKLSEYLEKPVRLVRASGSFHRRVSQNYVQNDNTLCYQDAYSVNWLFMESVSELQGLLGHPISYLNFRPNIVASGGSAGQEHLYFHLRIGNVEGMLAKPSTRCMITNVDPATGLLPKAGNLPLKVMFDNYNWIDKAGKRQAIFAENFLPKFDGIVSNSDAITALSERDPPLIYGKKDGTERLCKLGSLKE